MLAPTARGTERRASLKFVAALQRSKTLFCKQRCYGINIEGASIYITTQPCVVCAKMLINAGISEIIYRDPYPDPLAMELLEESGIKLRSSPNLLMKSKELSAYYRFV